MTIKDGQLTVQGPDLASATAISKQLSSGQAKLGNIGGKQVLALIAPHTPHTQADPSPAESSPSPSNINESQSGLVNSN